MYTWKQNLSEFSSVVAIGHWNSDKQALHVRERCIEHVFHMYC